MTHAHGAHTLPSRMPDKHHSTVSKDRSRPHLVPAMRGAGCSAPVRTLCQRACATAAQLAQDPRRPPSLNGPNGVSECAARHQYDVYEIGHPRSTRSSYFLRALLRHPKPSQTPTSEHDNRRYYLLHLYQTGIPHCKENMRRVPGLEGAAAIWRVYLQITTPRPGRCDRRGAYAASRRPLAGYTIINRPATGITSGPLPPAHRRMPYPPPHPRSSK